MPSVNAKLSPELLKAIGDNVSSAPMPTGPNPFVKGMDALKSAGIPHALEGGNGNLAMPTADKMVALGNEVRGMTSIRPESGSVAEISPDFQPVMQNFMSGLNAGGSPAPAGAKALKMPNGPGTKMFNILTLQKMMGDAGASKGMGAGVSNPALQDVFTRQPDAMKLAIQTLGIASPANPNGLSIDLNTAKGIWFGGKTDGISSSEEAAFRAIAQGGDQKIDRKMIKQYVNNDGSTTWEIKNPDKSIMSRFTLGSSDGKKVFTQGGYNEYAAELGEMAKKLSLNDKTNAAFEATRKKILGE